MTEAVQPPIAPVRPGARPFHESLPRQILALAGWVGLGLAAEMVMDGLGLAPRRQLAAWLAGMAMAGGIGLAVARAFLFRLLTSVRFALAQGLYLIAAVLLAGAGAGEVWPRLWFCGLLALLAVSMLAVTWKRRPYNLARLGFLLVHVAPAVVFLGTLWARFGLAPGPALWLVRCGFACLLAGTAWMFYLKPWLKRREGRP